MLQVESGLPAVGLSRGNGSWTVRCALGDHEKQKRKREEEDNAREGTCGRSRPAVAGSDAEGLDELSPGDSTRHSSPAISLAVAQ